MGRPQDITALARSSGMEEDQVGKAFDVFIEEHPDGKMRPKDFREMMQKALPKEDASKMEKHVFRIYDTNNDGYIDFTEFMLIYFIMDDGTPEEVLTSMFRMFDVNSDGTITQKEMTKLIKDMYGLLKEEDPELAARELVTKSAFLRWTPIRMGKYQLQSSLRRVSPRRSSARCLHS